MSDSFQNEMPKGRVNITLDVETEEGRKKKELPLKLLVVGDFSQGKTKGAIVERERINIYKNNFDKVLKELTPELTFVVANQVQPNSAPLKVNLKIDNMRKFHPEEIIQQIPELSNLLAMRNLLKDLKANLIDNATFRKELERILKNRDNVQALREQLNQLVLTN